MDLSQKQEILSFKTQRAKVRVNQDSYPGVWEGGKHTEWKSLINPLISQLKFGLILWRRLILCI